MTQWIDGTGATLTALAEHNRLWVVDKIPSPGENTLTGRPAYAMWIAEADESDTMMKLLDKWADGNIYKLARESQARSRQFIEHYQLSRETALVITNAHRLSKTVLLQIPRLDFASLIVLQGDVMLIGSKAADNLTFMGNAHFCVHTSKLFTDA